MPPPSSLCSQPPEGAPVSLGAARRETVPPSSLCSQPPEGAPVSLGAARRET
jgi:hypothetical protein